MFDFEVVRRTVGTRYSDRRGLVRISIKKVTHVQGSNRAPYSINFILGTHVKDKIKRNEFNSLRVSFNKKNWRIIYIEPGKECDYGLNPYNSATHKKLPQEFAASFMTGIVKPNGDELGIQIVNWVEYLDGIVVFFGTDSHLLKEKFIIALDGKDKFKKKKKKSR